MYAALFELDSWMGVQQCVFEGDTATNILVQLEEVQDLVCLVRMGKSRERSNVGKKSINMIETLLDKKWDGSLTIEDLLSLDAHLKVGDIKCVAVVEGEEAIAQLKASVDQN